MGCCCLKGPSHEPLTDQELTRRDIITERFVLREDKMKPQLREIIARLLFKNNFFHYFTREEANQVIDALRLSVIEKGGLVFEKGKTASYFYVMEEGSIRDPESGDTRMGMQVFGENALLFEHPYARTGEATSPCRLWVLKHGNEVVRTVRKRLTQVGYLTISKNMAMQFLTLQQRRQVAHNAVLRRYRPGETIFSRGEIAYSVVIVVEGELEVRIAGAKVSSVGIGELLGEGSLQAESKRGADVVTSRVTTLVEFSCDYVKAVLKEDVSKIINYNRSKWAIKRTTKLKSINPSKLDKLIKAIEEVPVTKGKQMAVSNQRINDLLVALTTTLQNESGKVVVGLG
jgi:CRP-like cAMP-binding protein